MVGKLDRVPAGVTGFVQQWLAAIVLEQGEPEEMAGQTCRCVPVSPAS
ncbi:hypothetical protein AB0M20_00560 [Actinoplanes sp. NPDC051633]